MAFRTKIFLILLIILLIDFAQSKLSEVPPPPRRPGRFNSREELKRYLQKVHEYHAILGRWRIRRDESLQVLSTHDTHSEPIDHLTGISLVHE